MSTGHIFKSCPVLLAVFTSVLSLRTLLFLVIFKYCTIYLILAKGAYEFGIWASFQVRGLAIVVQMWQEIPQLSGPVAANMAVGATNVEVVYGSLQTLVVHDGETSPLAHRARVRFTQNASDAALAEAVPTAANDERLAQDFEANGALDLKLFRWRLYEFAFVAFEH